MSRRALKWGAIGGAFVILGAAAFTWALGASGWRFSELFAYKYQTVTYEIDETFDEIFLKTNTADVTFVPSDGETCKVICYEEKNAVHEVAVVDGILEVSVKNNKKWYEHFCGFGASCVTVNLPNREYSSLL